MIEISRRHKQIGVLLDPDKVNIKNINTIVNQINLAQPDYILIGGSTVKDSIDPFTRLLRSLTSIPLILFPGDNKQISPEADALLLLSLISGRNSELLIGQHVSAARRLLDSGLDIIPTGYILVDGGRCSTTERVSHTTAISQEDISTIVDTALAGQLLGMKTIYLEAGSGAFVPVKKQVIEQVRKMISLPLIVGGGLRSTDDLRNALEGGADIVVVGNHFEQQPNDIAPFCHFVHSFKNTFADQ